MSQPLDGRVADNYAQFVKTVISSSADSAELITNLITHDESPVLQNQRLLQGLKNAIQTLAFSHSDAVMIQAAIASLGARFELDLPNG